MTIPELAAASVVLGVTVFVVVLIYMLMADKYRRRKR